MEHVLDTYKLPYDERVPVVCMDESPKQLIEEKASEPIHQGRQARIDYEYIRHGMVNVFMANEPLKGKRLVEITGYKTKKDWAKFLKRISDEMYPDAKKIKIVMDNYKTHDASAFYEVYPPEEAKRLRDRFEFVFTPKHGSWLNMAEIELHVLNGQCLNRHIDTMDRVREEVEAWEKQRNNKNAKIDWQFTNEKARIKLKSLYPSYSC
jgi:transposase